MKKKFVICTLIFMLCMIIKSENVFSANATFVLETMGEEEKAKVLEYLEITFDNVAPQEESIQCFDVSENGMLALGFSSGEEKYIGIYSQDGIFQYGYEFKNTGTYGIEWDENNIVIYTVRGNSAIWVTPQGEIDNIMDIKNTSENTSCWNYVLHTTKRNVGEKQYELRNKMGFLNFFASSYSQLIVTDSRGNTTILYDVNTVQLTRYIVWFVGISIFACGVGVHLLRLYKELKKKQK